jgi:hypothetical protein
VGASGDVTSISNVTDVHEGFNIGHLEGQSIDNRGAHFRIWLASLSLDCFFHPPSIVVNRVFFLLSLKRPY